MTRLSGQSPIVVIYDPEQGGYAEAPDDYCLARHPATGKLCGGYVIFQAGDFRLCGYHYERAIRWAEEQPAYDHETAMRLDEERQAQLVHYDQVRDEAKALRALERRETAAAAAEVEASLSIVYYLQRADGLIKIGTTVNAGKRMPRLISEHGHLEVLATHSGGYRAETKKHRQFAALRVEGEWFRPGLPLLEWILQVRKDGGVQCPQLPPTVDIRDIRDAVRELRAA